MAYTYISWWKILFCTKCARYWEGINCDPSGWVMYLLGQARLFRQSSLHSMCSTSRAALTVSSDSSALN
jgi:hypothetical protein